MPAFRAVQEWRKIRQKGQEEPDHGGYRGCFMDHGKIWFEASYEHGFRLVGIARNLPWVPLAEGRSIR